jgi:N6-L-threonylcarbamoyladenine synthase
MLDREEPHFSFAGLKTAVLRQTRLVGPLAEQDVADLCAAFEAAVATSVGNRVERAIEIADERLGERAPRHLVIAGGVAANRKIRTTLSQVASQHGYTCHVSPAELCTDNGVMIAWAGAERLARGWIDGPEFTARARWPLDAKSAPILGAGRHGAKA